MANLIEIILQAKDKASQEIKKVAGALGGIGSAAQGAQKGMGSLGDSAQNLYGTWIKASAGIGAAVIAMKEVYEFSEEAAQISRLQDAGYQLAASMGSDMDDIVEAVRDASLGTVSDLDIIGSANKAMMLGVSADADKLANLMEIAALRGRAMGLSTTQAFDDIVRGVGRMSPLILDNLGIIVDADSTYGSYAKSLGKTASELSSTEKRQALLNRVIEEGNAQLEKTGGLQNDAASGYERNAASMKNATDKIKMFYNEHFHLGQALNMIVDPQQELNLLLGDHQKELLNSGLSVKEYNRSMREFGNSLGISNQNMRLFGYTMDKTTYSQAVATAQAMAHTKAINQTSASLGMANARYLQYQQTLSGGIDTGGVAKGLGESGGTIQQYTTIINNMNKNLDDAEKNVVDLAIAAVDERFVRGSENSTKALAAIDKAFGTNIVRTQNFEKSLKGLLSTQNIVSMSQTELTEALRGAAITYEFKLDALVTGADDVEAASKTIAFLTGLPSKKTYTLVMRYLVYGTPFSTAPDLHPSTSNKGGMQEEEMAKGGSFVVPPGYPSDTYVPPIKLTSGERVDITPYGKSKAGGTTVVVNYSPAVALGDRYEAESVLAPMIQRALRGMV